jgi:urease accessory protein
MDAFAEPRIAAPPTLQRARGAARIRVGAADGRTRLERLFQDGCGKIRLPRDAAAEGLSAVMINTCGGLTGGDRLTWRGEAGPEAALTLTTQACEKIYRAQDDRAEVRVALAAEAGARLAWLPQETILFDGADLDRRFEVDLAQDARLLAAEAVVLGRTAMGEVVRRGRFRDRWRVRRAGRLIFADEVLLAGDVAGAAGRRCALAGARAFATILWVAEEADRSLDAVREALGPTGGASAFDGKLVARIVAADGLALRRALVAALEALRAAPLPRIWRS